jgi:hypothetical protein
MVSGGFGKTIFYHCAFINLNTAEALDSNMPIRKGYGAFSASRCG